MSENLLNKYFINEIFAYTVECKAHSSKNSDENNNNSSLYSKVINSYRASLSQASIYQVKFKFSIFNLVNFFNILKNNWKFDFQITPW